MFLAKNKEYKVALKEPITWAGEEGISNGGDTNYLPVNTLL